MARRDGLLIEELTDEIVIYDTERQRAHSLNQAAAVVWKNSDGRKTVAELAAIVAVETSLPEDPAIVTDALEQLGEKHLLRSEPVTRTTAPDTTRRELLKRMGVLAALLPVVLSITAPTPAMSQSAGGPTGQTGSTGPTGPTGEPT